MWKCIVYAEGGRSRCVRTQDPVGVGAPPTGLVVCDSGASLRSESARREEAEAGTERGCGHYSMSFGVNNSKFDLKREAGAAAQCMSAIRPFSINPDARRRTLC